MDRKDRDTVYTIYCEDREFSSLEFGPRLFQAVSRHILLRRSSGEDYPIYITDIDLSPTLMVDTEAKSLQTIDYLSYKKIIEEKLHEALTTRNKTND